MRIGKALAACLAALSSCDDGTPTESMTVDGHERQYILHVPDGLREGGPHPLVLVLHGGGGGGRGVTTLPRYTGMNAKADRERFIVAYPATLEENWNDGRNAPDLREQKDNVNDVAFLVALVDKLAGELPVDRTRVYATGISNGAMMSHRLACDAADRFAAVAPVAASMPEPLSTSCAPSRAVPILMIHGTEDAYVPFGGGSVSELGDVDRGRVISARDSLARWVALDGCTDAPIVSRQDHAPLDATEIERIDHRACRDGAAVSLLVVHGGGHSWPGARPVPPLGRTSRVVYANGGVGDVFEDRALP